MRSVTFFTEKIKNRHNPECDTHGNVGALEVTWAEANLAEALEDLEADFSEQIAGLAALEEARVEDLENVRKRLRKVTNNLERLAYRVAALESHLERQAVLGPGPDSGHRRPVSGPPLVFTDPDHFVQEIREAQRATGRPIRVRVWAGSVATGDSRIGVSSLRLFVALQAINVEAVAASLFVSLGGYQTVYGQPVGPTAKRRKEILSANVERARRRVEDWISGMAPVTVLPGRYFLPEIDGSNLELVKLERLAPLYRALAQGAEPEDVFSNGEGQ